MTLKTQRIHIVAGKQTRIRRSMRGVAKCTAIRPDRRMLIDEGTGCLGVTFYADHITCDAAMQSLVLEGAMWIVTIAAID